MPLLDKDDVVCGVMTMNIVSVHEYFIPIHFQNTCAKLRVNPPDYGMQLTRVFLQIALHLVPHFFFISAKVST